ncbi:MAG: hypothetical protein JRH18_25295 [Deltaproteobacteria bacterium]|nr:hypothetical protein [Deltaproteobacteria bacterium]MBW2154960.1 hypothetical protein [Deltaproteobacteria bacterium]
MFELQKQSGKAYTIRKFPLGNLTGQVGVRRDPQNPNRKQKIFGYNLVLTSSVEMHLKLELPVAVSNIPGNAEEGSQIIVNNNQIAVHHRCQIKIDIADFHPVK